MKIVAPSYTVAQEALAVCENIVGRLRSIASEMLAEPNIARAVAALAFLENYERYEGRLLRAHRLTWTNNEGDTITIECVPPALVRVVSLCSPQFLDDDPGYYIGDWRVQLAELHPQVRNVFGLHVDALTSEEVRNRDWEPIEDANGKLMSWLAADRIGTDPEIVFGDPCTALSRWRPFDTDKRFSVGLSQGDL